jgi:hypothetical protein
MEVMNMINRNNYKKLCVIIGVAAMILITLTGCSTNAYELYQNSELKTSEAKTGVYDMEVRLENQFDTSQMTDAQLKKVNYMKQIAFKSKNTVDKEKKDVISETWMSIGGIGFDFTYYGNNDESYIKYPVLKKYIKINTNNMGSADEKKVISEVTQKQLSQIWKQLASETNVKLVDEIFVSTAEGDVKAKHIRVNASNEEVKQAIIESYNLIKNDKRLQDTLQGFANKSGEENAGTLNMDIKDLKIESFEISDYVNADGYLVKDEVNIVMSGFGKENDLEKTNFHLSTVYSQLNQKVELQFPEITPDQIFSDEELNKEMPAVFKDLIQ